MKLPSYRLYPTLIDAYAWYLKSDKDDALQELINKINRVPYDVSEAAQKGSAFEAAAIANNPNFKDYGFKPEIVQEFHNEMNAMPQQVFTSGFIDTSFGLVELYGYVDYIRENMALDAKTTSKYEFPKYLHNMQHNAYLFTLRQKGIMVDTFRYKITDFNYIYHEDYHWNEQIEFILKLRCEEFIDFLEMHKHLITDKKIFNLQ